MLSNAALVFLSVVWRTPIILWLLELQCRAPRSDTMHAKMTRVGRQLDPPSRSYHQALSGD